VHFSNKVLEEFPGIALPNQGELISFYLMIGNFIMGLVLGKRSAK